MKETGWVNIFLYSHSYMYSTLYTPTTYRYSILLNNMNKQREKKKNMIEVYIYYIYICVWGLVGVCESMLYTEHVRPHYMLIVRRVSAWYFERCEWEEKKNKEHKIGFSHIYIICPLHITYLMILIWSNVPYKQMGTCNLLTKNWFCDFVISWSSHLHLLSIFYSASAIPHTQSSARGVFTTGAAPRPLIEQNSTDPNCRISLRNLFAYSMAS